MKMKFLLDEISEYLNHADLAKVTKRPYFNALMEFTEFLANLLNCHIDEVHLERIFHFSFNGTEEDGLYSQIDATILDNYFEANISKGYSWLSYTKSALSGLFRYLSLNYDFSNVLYDVEFRLQDHKKSKIPQRVPNRHEVLRLMWSIIKYSEKLKRDALLFVTLFSTGCRIGEVLSLTWRDILVENEMFFLKRTKNKRQKYIVTRFGLTKVFQLYCEQNRIGKDDYIFTNEKAKPLTQGNVRLLLDGYLKKANIPHFVIHSTRKSFATIMYENGTDITIIQQLLNHVFLNSTEIYIKDNYIRNNDLEMPIYKEINKNLKQLVGR